MIEVSVESIRVSLINQSRLVVLREQDGPRYLSIWIGAFEADAITIGLQESEVPRPMTHDLIHSLFGQLGAELKAVHISELREETFFGELVAENAEGELRVDCRSSDAIAVAVRADVPIFVAEKVMDEAGAVPAPEYEGSEDTEESEAAPKTSGSKERDDSLELFRDFFEGIDLNLEEDEDEDGATPSS